MKLQNLQIRFHGKDHLQHRITYVNENGTQCRETLCSGVDFAKHVIDCLEYVPELTLARDEAQSQISDITKMLVESSTMKRNINSSIESLIEIANAPDTTQPQLSEIRYVLHGDIQPCSVLYSDDTTTLLRLDEGDIMCETDTIEWSDSVMYRCQELLKGESKRSNIPVTLSPVKLLAQLVRDERILLNDNGVDELGADEAYFREENKSCVAAVVPAPPPFPRGAADHNNPYVHTTPMFSETAMRSHGWTDEALVSCGHGHYAPVQHPATPGSEWTDNNNSPTTLR